MLPWESFLRKKGDGTGRANDKSKEFLDMKELLNAFKDRRSIYALGKGGPLTDEKIIELVEEGIRHTPSAFNMQDQRAIVLLGSNHEKFWNIVLETLRARVSAESFPKTEAKIQGFAAGRGTILWFVDTATVARYQEQFPSYAANFTDWSEQQQGMAQYAVWTLLEAEGMGANLQHYNPIVDDEVKRTWNVPAEWRLRAQMVFGSIEAPAGEKEFLPISNRVLIYKD